MVAQETARISRFEWNAPRRTRRRRLRQTLTKPRRVAAHFGRQRGPPPRPRRASPRFHEACHV